MADLTHVDEQGNARMVDVGDKDVTVREATAEGWITLGPEAYAAIEQRRVKKGDVLAIAQLAGIAAAKRTPDLVPLCHPIPLTGVKVDVALAPPNRVHVTGRVRCAWKTGVEMEALTATSAALLTVYDMVKAVDKGPVLGPIQLVAKSGGKSGTWARQQDT